MTEPRGRGRASAADVARRRLEAEEYLKQHFSRSATLWARLRSEQMSADEFAETIRAMILEAKSVKAPELQGDRDKQSLNPEQAVALILQRAASREKKIIECRAELATLDTVRKAIEQLLDAHQDAARKDLVELTAAAAQRPTVDREVERRRLDILRMGASRANIIRLKQNADKLWNRPISWADLPTSVGRFTISDRPASGDIELEPLPPSAQLTRYCPDPSAFRAKVANATPETYIDMVEALLADWITLNYPGPHVRKPAVMATAWATLLLVRDPTLQGSNRRIDVLLPSAWKAGRVMRIA